MEHLTIKSISNELSSDIAAAVLAHKSESNKYVLKDILLKVNTTLLQLKAKGRRAQERRRIANQVLVKDAYPK